MIICLVWQAWSCGGVWLAKSVFTRAQYPFIICFTPTVPSAVTSICSALRRITSPGWRHPFGVFSGCPRCGVNPAGTSFLPCDPSIAGSGGLPRPRRNKHDCRGRRRTSRHIIRLLDQPDRPCENVIRRWSLHLRDSRVSPRRYRLKVRT